MARRGSDPCAQHPGSVSSLAPRSSRGEFPFSEVFFQIAQMLFLALQLYYPPCICLYCKVGSPPVPAQSFPYKMALFLIPETAVSSCSEQAFEHIYVPLQGISSNLFLLACYTTLLLGGPLQVSRLPKPLTGSGRGPAPANRIAVPQRTTCSLN